MTKSGPWNVVATAGLSLRVAAIGLGLLPATAEVAQAGCTVPFTISTPQAVPSAKLRCRGPWLRESSCVTIQTGEDHTRFYCADQTVLSMWGRWHCTIFSSTDSCKGDALARADFCIESDGPNELDLLWIGGGGLIVDAPACSSIEAAGFLGHNASGAGDRDVFDLAGRPGERLRISLDRDGTAGGTGEVATLAVKSKAGAELGRRTGKLPLTFDVTLADAGAVLAVGGAQGESGDSYRGGYVLSVRPASGKAGERLLRPRPNVEP